MSKHIWLGNKLHKFTFGFFIWLMIFIAAFTLIIYSLLEIWQTQRLINNALEDWDKQHLSLKNVEGLNLENGTETVEDVLQNSSETKLVLPAISSIESKQESKLKKPIVGKSKVIGKITLDRLRKSFPIIEGTNAASLEKGVGHYSSSVLPGQLGNSVFAGHRDSVFRKLGELIVNDEISLEMVNGTYTYAVTGSKIVEADDTSLLLSSDLATITLITCYPFHYVGNAPKRFLLFATLVE